MRTPDPMAREHQTDREAEFGPTTQPIPIAIIDGDLSEGDEDTSTPPRRWSLRAKLIGLVIAVAALALVVADVALPIVVRAALTSSRDAALATVVARATSSSLLNLQEESTNSTLRGEFGFTMVLQSGKTFYGGTSDRDPGPAITDTTLTGAQTVEGLDGTEYRAQFLRVTQDGLPALLVIWSPMDDIEKTIDQLIFAELLISAGLLVLLGAAASLLIRRELIPLEEMAAAADQIATGDIDLRVDATDSGTEVERLGNAFNGMLDGISLLLDERQAAEDRLRQFVSDASHELRTPVAAVRGYTDLYAAGALPEKVAVDRAMLRMGFESRRMAALVDDLLTLMRADAPSEVQYVPVDLTELLTGVVDDAAAIDPSRVWRLAGADTHPVVSGDRLTLHQVFANLLSNIRTHTPEGSAATVAILTSTRSVTVSVSDNGPGVGTESLSKLFDRFYREDSSRSRANGGAGLGLSIVAAIVKAHGGSVAATHAVTGGLQVSVTLPLMVVAAPVTPAGAAAALDPAPGAAPAKAG